MDKDYDENIMYELAQSKNISYENIEFIIRAFSYFISSFNKDYVYNRTYLPSYFNEFRKCRNNIILKEKAIRQITYELNKKYLNQGVFEDVIIKFDCSWEFYDGKLKYKNTKTDIIMKKEIYVECIYKKKNIQVVDYYESDNNEKIIGRISEFIDLIINKGDENK
ncbi:hypothetical protein AL714_00315 [Clostridium botulinum]|uniref:hypothetical protein n=1 Tax=Clostridium botulinum TaxID=1491 RepID=UPI00099CA331|nr:hypothetical protein [Clostridium botulinum]OPD38845.1 hypothetical protein AL714_00315 [Clostridium botulinum]